MKYFISILITATLFISGCGKVSTVSESNNSETASDAQSSTTSNLRPSSEDNFKRRIYLAQYQNSSTYDLFLERIDEKSFTNNGKLVNNKITSAYPNKFEIQPETKQVIMETSPDSIALFTSTSPDNKLILFSVYSQTNLTIATNTPSQHDRYVSVQSRSAFIYNFASGTVRSLFDSNNDSIDSGDLQNFCPDQFSPDGLAALFTCRSDSYVPDNTFSGMVYSLATDKLYDLNLVGKFEWLKNGQFRYKEITEKNCTPTKRYICRTDSECNICYVDESATPWKYVRYK
jgi:hypothetical protein